LATSPGFIEVPALTLPSERIRMRASTGSASSSPRFAEKIRIQVPRSPLDPTPTPSISSAPLTVPPGSEQGGRRSVASVMSAASDTSLWESDAETSCRAGMAGLHKWISPLVPSDEYDMEQLAALRVQLAEELDIPLEDVPRMVPGAVIEDFEGSSGWESSGTLAADLSDGGERPAAPAAPAAPADAGDSGRSRAPQPSPLGSGRPRAVSPPPAPALSPPISATSEVTGTPASSATSSIKLEDVDVTVPTDAPLVLVTERTKKMEMLHARQQHTGSPAKRPGKSGTSDNRPGKSWASEKSAGKSGASEVPALLRGDSLHNGNLGNLEIAEDGSRSPEKPPPGSARSDGPGLGDDDVHLYVRTDGRASGGAEAGTTGRSRASRSSKGRAKAFNFLRSLRGKSGKSKGSPLKDGETSEDEGQCEQWERDHWRVKEWPGEQGRRSSDNEGAFGGPAAGSKRRAIGARKWPLGHMLASIIRRASEARSTVILLDDLHTFDPLSLELLQIVAATCPKLMIVCTANNEAGMAEAEDKAVDRHLQEDLAALGFGAGAVEQLKKPAEAPQLRRRSSQVWTKGPKDPKGPREWKDQDKRKSVVPTAVPEGQKSRDLRMLMGLDRTVIKNLEVLRKEDAYAMIFQMLSSMLSVEILGPIIPVVYEKTSGHPLYIEQICVYLLEYAVRMQVDVEESEGDQDAHMLMEKLVHHVKTSVTIHSVITSRVDQLEPSAQLTLKVGSVIGASLEVGVLLAVHPLGPTFEQLQRDLATLQAFELIIPDDDDNEVWHFASQLTRDVTYQLLPFQQRKGLHEKLAVLLEGSGTGGRGPPPALYATIAFHFTTAAGADVGQLHGVDNPQMAERAVFWWEQAAEEALKSPEVNGGVFCEVCRLYEEALRISDALELQNEAFAINAERRAYWMLRVGASRVRTMEDGGNWISAKNYLLDGFEMLGVPSPPADNVVSAMKFGRFGSCLCCLEPPAHLPDEALAALVDLALAAICSTDILLLRYCSAVSLFLSPQGPGHVPREGELVELYELCKSQIPALEAEILLREGGGLGAAGPGPAARESAESFSASGVSSPVSSLASPAGGRGPTLTRRRSLVQRIGSVIIPNAMQRALSLDLGRGARVDSPRAGEEEVEMPGPDPRDETAIATAMEGLVQSIGQKVNADKKLKMGRAFRSSFEVWAVDADGAYTLPKDSKDGDAAPAAPIISPMYKPSFTRLPNKSFADPRLGVSDVGGFVPVVRLRNTRGMRSPTERGSS